MVVGDSFSDGSSDWPNQTPVFGIYTPLTFAVGGKSLNGMEADFAADLVTALNADAEILVIQGGINDIFFGTSELDMLADVQSMVSQALAAGMRHVYIGNMPPFGSNAGWTAARQASADAYDVLLSNWVATQSLVSLVDINSALDTDGNDELDPGLDQGDGLHPANNTVNSGAGMIALANAYVSAFSC